MVLAAALTGLGKVLTGSVLGQVGYGCLFVAGSFLFIWFSIRLLGGGLGWRRLLPTAVFTTIGLLGLGGFSMIFFSSSIVSNDKSYGSIGVVFIILSWLIGVGVVVMGAAVMGAWYEAAGLSFTRGVRRLSGKGGDRGGKQSPAQADDRAGRRRRVGPRRRRWYRRGTPRWQGRRWPPDLRVTSD